MRNLRYWFMSLGLMFLALLVATPALSQNVAHKHDQRKEHTRVGMHGMVLVTDGEALYASHLPLYRSPHDYQLVYLVESEHKSELIARLMQTRQGDEPLYKQNMVTLLPARFDLNLLIDGQPLQIETQLFKGHFERGGEKWMKDARFKFVRQVYKRPLSALKPTTQSQTLNWQALNQQSAHDSLFIYTIQTPPSFDAIVLGKACKSGEEFTVSHSAQVPTVQQLKAEFDVCNARRVMYFETQDFAQ